MSFLSEHGLSQPLPVWPGDDKSRTFSPIVYLPGSIFDAHPRPDWDAAVEEYRTIVWKMIDKLANEISEYQKRSLCLHSNQPWRMFLGQLMRDLSSCKWSPKVGGIWFTFSSRASTIGRVSAQFFPTEEQREHFPVDKILRNVRIVAQLLLCECDLPMSMLGFELTE
jgi:hypothetical protein